MQILKTAAWFLASLPLATSHGGGMIYTIDGVAYPGTHESVLDIKKGSIQRMYTWDAIVDTSDPYLACRRSGDPYDISYHAPMKSGSTINVNYTFTVKLTSGDLTWAFGHAYGPMNAHMAACPDTGCESVDLTAPIWFKIWEAGLLSGTWTEGHWAIADIANNYSTLDIPTPKGLKSGKYLLKHDMISIETGQMQIFPNCIQLEVSGDGTEFPEDEELVAFPGGYDGFDGLSWEPPNSGAEWFWVEKKDETFYPMPGPPVWEG